MLRENKRLLRVYWKWLRKVVWKFSFLFFIFYFRDLLIYSGAGKISAFQKWKGPPVCLQLSCKTAVLLAANNISSLPKWHVFGVLFSVLCRHTAWLAFIFPKFIWISHPGHAVAHLTNDGSTVISCRTDLQCEYSETVLYVLWRMKGMEVGQIQAVCHCIWSADPMERICLLWIFNSR